VNNRQLMTFNYKLVLWIRETDIHRDGSPLAKLFLKNIQNL